jgi:two-component SAPR family response regulator
MLVRFLIDKGFRTLEAATGREVITLLEDRDRQPDILLLDVMLLDVSGFTVLEYLSRTERRAMPVLLITGRQPGRSLLDALDTAHRDFMIKPFDFDELLLRVQHLLRNAHGQPLQSAHEIRVYALGSLRVYRGETLLFDESWHNRPGKNVFKLLLTLRGQHVSKERLIEELWPEVEIEAGINRLRVAVHDLRTQVGDTRPAGTARRIIDQHEGAYTFDPSERCWTDVQAFNDEQRRGRNLARQGRLDEALTSYGQAEALYQGQYLRDDSLSEWLIAPREHLHEDYLTLLGQIGEIQARLGRPDEAVRYYRTILRLAPWREDVYRRLMEILVAAGRRREALQVFEECRRVLQAEEIAVSRETWAVGRRIMAESGRSRTARGVAPAR